MPNKTIYVADADLPILERAQELAGENLSATIVQALQRLIRVQEARARGVGEIVLKLGNNGTYTSKAFLGRELAKRRARDPNAHRIVSQNVYQTAKGRLVLYTRTFPDWYVWQSFWEEDDWAQRGSSRHQDVDVNVDVDVDVDADVASGDDRAQRRRRGKQYWQQWQQRQQQAWSAWSGGSDCRMEIFEALEDLKPHIPEELYSVVAQALKGEDVEFLDI
jgi:EXLDI family protein